MPRPDSLTQELGDRIRAARAADGALSQIDLARKLGVSERTVQNWESGVVPWRRHRAKLMRWLERVERKIAAAAEQTEVPA